MNPNLQNYYNELDAEIADSPMSRRQHEKLKVIASGFHDFAQKLTTQQKQEAVKTTMELNAIKKEFEEYKSKYPPKTE